METSFRDDAIAKNRVILKLALYWSFTATIALIVMSLLCIYAMRHQQTHWLPLCTGSELSIGEASYSPSYLKQMSSKVADLRLTYSPETIEDRYDVLLNLMPANQQEVLKKMLNTEIQTVKKKNITSVFYSDQPVVDVQQSIAKIEGTLYRSSHGLEVKPKHKTYLIKFAFSNGLLWPKSFEEMNDEHH